MRVKLQVEITFKQNIVLDLEIRRYVGWEEEKLETS